MSALDLLSACGQHAIGETDKLAISDVWASSGALAT